MSREYTFSDVWQSAAADEEFDYVFWLDKIITLVVRRTVRVFGFILVLAAVIIIIGIMFSGFLIVLPKIAPNRNLWFLFNVLLGILMSVNLTFNYMMAIVTKPGHPAESVRRQVCGNIEEGGGEEEKSVCKKCYVVKPERAHHCSVCQKCVLKYDHHCPWINNCVGLNNYRFFFLFLFWAFLSTLYLCFMTVGPVFLAFTPWNWEIVRIIGLHAAYNETDVRVPSIHSPQQQQQPSSSLFLMLHRAEEIIAQTLMMKSQPELACIFVTFLVCYAVLVTSGILLAVHTYLVVSAQTTVEWVDSLDARQRIRARGGKDVYRSRYNLGTSYQNFTQVFGSSPLYYFLVPSFDAALPAVPTSLNGRLAHKPADVETGGIRLSSADVEEEADVEMQPLFSRSYAKNNTYELSKEAKPLVVRSFSENKRRVVAPQSKSLQMLFADEIWPGSIVLSDFLVAHPEIVRGRDVVELGAGAALPSMVCARLEANLVVCTDFPSEEILDNIRTLFDENGISQGVVIGYEFGAPLDCLRIGSVSYARRYDVVILAELLWKDTYVYHVKMLESLSNLLAEDGVAFVSFAHRPVGSHTPQSDLEFFRLAEESFQFKATLFEVNKKYCDVGCDDEEYTEVQLWALTWNHLEI